MRLRFLLFLFFPLYIQAQQLSNPFETLGTTDIEARKHLYLSGSYSINSTGITNMLYNNILLGDYISNEVKDNTLGYLKDQTRAGAVGNFNALFSWQHGKGVNGNSTNLFIGYQDRIQLGMLMDKDLYRLIFYGNAGFAGETVDIEKTVYRRVKYAQLDFGLYKVKTTYDHKIIYGASIGAVNGKSLLDLYLENTSLYTSPSGDSLALSLNYHRRGAVPDSNVVYKISGVGAAMNLFVNYYLNKDDYVHASISNLGIINWTNRINRNTIDHDFTFTGFEVNLFTENLSSLNVNSITDSLKKESNTNRKTDAFTTVMPAQLALTYINKLNERFKVSAGAYYITWAYHRPEVFATLQSNINENWQIGTGVSVFGYGKYGVLLSSGFKIKERWNLRLGTDHLEGYILPKKTFGQGAFISLTADLK